MAALLEVKGLKAFYGQTQVLFDLGFDIAEGGITTLLGANGAGKTTTLRCVAGIIPPSAGTVRIGGFWSTGYILTGTNDPTWADPNTITTGSGHCWFDASGKPALGALTRHFPWNTANANYRGDLQAWFGSSEPHVQRTLDTALAWARGGGPQSRSLGSRRRRCRRTRG